MDEPAGLVDSAQQASNARLAGTAAKSPTTPNAQRTKALTMMTNGIAQFKKVDVIGA